MTSNIEVKASSKHIQISPQKVRLIIDLIRGMDAYQALEVLNYLPNKASRYVFKLLESAIANAEENFALDGEDLYIKSIYANEADKQRLRPFGGRFGARGRFKPIIKRSTHLTIILSEHS